MDNKDKVRIINDKGEVKHVSPKIAGNAKLLKSYGFRVEDFKKEEKAVPNGIEKVLLEEKPEFEETETNPEFEPEVIKEEAQEERVVLNVPTIDFVRKEYEALTGKKPGIKKLETLVKEMNEINGLNK